MNKFNTNGSSFSDAFWFSIGLGTIVYVSALYSDSPKYQVFTIASLFVLIPYLYLAFIEKNKNVLNQWFTKVAVTFSQFILMSLLAYFDSIWFRIE